MRKRKSIGNHERGDPIAEKHGETERLCRTK
jgi:hypothetical protein